MTEQDIRPLGRASRGVTGIRLSNGDELAGALRVDDNSQMLVMTECGIRKTRGVLRVLAPMGGVPADKRCIRYLIKPEKLWRLISVTEKDEVVCITSQGKTPPCLKPIPSVQWVGRAQGVRILNIERPDILIGMDTVANEEEELPRSEANTNFVSIAGELDLDGSDDVVDPGLVEEDDGTEEPQGEKSETDDSEE